MHLELGGWGARRPLRLARCVRAVGVAGFFQAPVRRPNSESHDYERTRTYAHELERGTGSGLGEPTVMNASRWRPMLPGARSGRRGGGAVASLSTWVGRAVCARGRAACAKGSDPCPSVHGCWSRTWPGGWGLLQLCLMSGRRRVICSSVKQRRCRERDDMFILARFVCIGCGASRGPP